MAAELKLTKISPTTGTNIDVEGNIIIGTDAAPKALEVKGNVTGGANLDITGDIIADNISIREIPTLDGHLITKGYYESETPIVANYLNGFGLSNGTSPNTEIDIEAGTCRDATNMISMTLSSPITIDISTSGVGGLDDGTVTLDTWYYIFIIYNPTTEATDAIFSTSKTAPIMPVGYTYKKRIPGVILTDGSSNINKFIQEGPYIFWDALVDDYNQLNPLEDSAVLATISVPPDMMGYVIAGLTHNYNYENYVLFTSPYMTDIAPTASLFHLYSINTSAANFSPFFIKVNASSQMRYRVSGTETGTSVNIHTIGFIDLGN